MSAQDFMLRHFVQVSMAGVAARISSDTPSDNEGRADALGCPGDQVD